MKHVMLYVFFVLVGCGGTERTRISFPVTVSARTANLVTDSGWAVQLTGATADLATARFYSGKVLLSQRRRWSPLDLLVSPAWAHPGHYVPGEAMAELLTGLTVDLLATPATSWGTAQGVTGEYGSVQLAYAAGGVRLQGTATKGALTVSFDTGAFTPPKTVEGVKFDRAMTSGQGTVDVRFDLGVILSRIDFGAAGSGASPLDRTSQAFNGFVRGVEDTTAYVITWQ